MTAYYNEWDAYPAEWLRRLIAAGHLPDGYVDERDIREVEASDVRGYDQAHFFAGIGGWPLALRLAGWPDDAAVWTGSPPCQPFSSAGRRRGIADERHLAPTWLALVRECRPPVLFGEQVAPAVRLHGWLDALFDALEADGYTCQAAVLPACSVGAPHVRQRLFFGAVWLSDADLQRCDRLRLRISSWRQVEARAEATWGREVVEWRPFRDGKARPIESGTEPLADGVSARVGRLRAYGNAIVHAAAAAFIHAFCEWAHDRGFVELTITDS